MKLYILRSAIIAVALFLTGAGFAQDPGVFAQACEAKLPNIQVGRRICVVGEVLPDERLRVYASTRISSVGKTIMVTAIPPQAGQSPMPLKEFADLKGRWIAVGGFENGEDLYSGRLF